jgi:hypothetical protein
VASRSNLYQSTVSEFTTKKFFIYFKILMRNGCEKTAARKRLRATAESALLQTGGHSPFAREGARTKKILVWKKDG